MDLLLALNRLLAALPGNGWKTNVGAILALLGTYGLPIVSDYFPWLLNATPAVESVGSAVLAVGLAHKAVKTFIKGSTRASMAEDSINHG